MYAPGGGVSKRFSAILQTAVHLHNLAFLVYQRGQKLPIWCIMKIFFLNLTQEVLEWEYHTILNYS